MRRRPSRHSCEPKTSHARRHSKSQWPPSNPPFPRCPAGACLGDGAHCHLLRGAKRGALGVDLHICARGDVARHGALHLHREEPGGACEQPSQGQPAMGSRRSGAQACTSTCQLHAASCMHSKHKTHAYHIAFLKVPGLLLEQLLKLPIQVLLAPELDPVFLPWARPSILLGFSFRLQQRPMSPVKSPGCGPCPVRAAQRASEAQPGRQHPGLRHRRRWQEPEPHGHP